MILRKLEEAREDSSGAKIIIIDYILNFENYEEITASQIARECYVSKSYVTKFSKEFGYKNFDNLRMDLVRDNEYGLRVNEGIANFKINQYANEVVNTLIGTTNSINEDNIKQVVSLLNESHEIILLGIGSSSIICEDLYYKLIRLNYNVRFEKDESVKGMVVKNATCDTVALVFSYSGPTQSTQKMMEILKKRKAKVILITKSEEKYCEDVRLKLYSSEELDRSFSIYSRISMTFISDLLYLYLRDKRFY